MSPEQLIALLNIRMILGLTKFKVNKSDILAGLNLQKEISKLVSQLIKGEDIEMTSPASMKDIAELQKATIEVQPEQILQEAMPLLDKQKIDAIAVGNALVPILDFLKTQIPEDAVSDDSFLGIPPVESSKSLQIKFLWSVRIAENPLWLFKLMSDQMLGNIDVQATMSMYPDIFDMIVEEIIVQIIDTFKINTALPRKLKLMLSVLLGIPVLSVKTIVAYQKADIEKEEEDTASKGTNLDIQTTDPVSGKGDL